MLARARKAFIAALLAGGSAAASSLTAAAAKGSITQGDVLAAVGLAVPAALLAGIAVYNVRNEGLPGGSELR